MLAARSMPPTFLAGLVVANRRCVVLGADAEAVDKSLRLHAAGACVELYATQLPERLHALHAQGELAWRERAPEPSDFDGVFLVIDCRRDAPAAEALYQRARAPGGFLLCAIDQPPYCTLTSVAAVRRGPVQIAIATDGRAPMLAGRIRAALDAQLRDDFADFAERLAALRDRTPPEQRRAVLAAALSGFTLSLTYALPVAPDPPSHHTAESAQPLPPSMPRSRPVHKRRGSR